MLAAHSRSSPRSSRNPRRASPDLGPDAGGDREPGPEARRVFRRASDGRQWSHAATGSVEGTTLAWRSETKAMRHGSPPPVGRVRVWRVTEAGSTARTGRGVGRLLVPSPGAPPPRRRPPRCRVRVPGGAPARVAEVEVVGAVRSHDASRLLQRQRDLSQQDEPLVACEGPSAGPDLRRGQGQRSGPVEVARGAPRCPETNRATEPTVSTQTPFAGSAT